MKKLLFLLALGATAYWAWNYIDQANIDPVYAEFRVKYPDGIELVGIGKMNSQSDCEQRTEKFWRNALASNISAEMSTIKCGIQLPSRFEALFSNQVAAATYIAMDRGNPGERDGRFIIYGAPSSEVMKVCPALIASIRQKYKGNIQCIQGKVG